MMTFRFFPNIKSAVKEKRLGFRCVMILTWRFALYRFKAGQFLRGGFMSAAAAADSMPVQLVMSSL